MKKHTFVIPAYRESLYLEECIRHLLAQTVESHIVITTSTPTLHTEQLAKKYNLVYHINPKAESIADDWNFALAQSQTPLVTIAHQDDIYEPDYVQAITTPFDKYKANEVLIAFTDYQDIVNGKTRAGGINAIVKHSLLLPFFFKKKITSRFFKQLILRFGDPICCPSVTFNKAALGNFSFSPDYKVALDWYAWYQLSNQPGAFLYIDKKLIRHRIHDQSETVRQINSGLRKQEEQRIFELFWGKTLARLITAIYAIGHKDNL
jgi:glycosyltransferase involved in cell wall biosynthesis